MRPVVAPTNVAACPVGLPSPITKDKVTSMIEPAGATNENRVVVAGLFQNDASDIAGGPVRT